VDFRHSFGNILATPMSQKKRRYIRENWPKVKKVLIRNQPRFQVDGRPHRERAFFRNESDALVQADVWARERENQGIEALEFPTTLRVQATEAAKLLEPFGKTLMDATRHYVAFLNEQAAKKSALSVQACLDSWIASKRTEAGQKVLATRTIQELENRAQLFSAAFGQETITQVDGAAVETFLNSLQVGQRTRLNIRTKLGQFFNFCRRRKWIGSNPTESIKVRVPSKDVTILSPEEAKRLLDAAEASELASSIVPYVTISLFAGLRPGEVEQLRWEFINFETAEIEVRGNTSKGRETRFVHIEDTLLYWLQPYRTPAGALIPRHFRHQWEEVRIAAGYAIRGNKGKPWPEDVLRHSYGSYWLAKHGDRARLAELMGNSIEVIKKHYRRAIPKRESEIFWALRSKEDSLSP
jgi:integrase